MEFSYLTAVTAFSDSANSNSSVFFGADVAPTMAEALRCLSDKLGAAFQSPEFEFCADACIVVGASGGGGPPREVRVHRCVLAARSPFFREVFATRERAAVEPRMELRELVKDVEVGYEALVAVVGYLYRGRVAPSPPREVCTCVDEECRPAIDFLVEVLYASYTFEIPELVNLLQRHLLDILDKVAIDDISVVLSVASLCDKSCTRLLKRCIDIIIRSDLDNTNIEKILPQNIVKQITDTRKSLGLVTPGVIGFPDKHIRRIYRALDSDDIELVRMLMKEGHATLDDVYALHYAVAYCDSKITIELLDLALDVNHRNLRGYTVLHVAAMRKEPKIIVSVLTKGARPADLTLDGRKALQISKRLTKYVDYHKSTEEGKACPKDRLCIEILEQAERREPQIGEASISLSMAGDHLQEKLLYLEN